jgi:hypothetical protein
MQLEACHAEYAMLFYGIGDGLTLRKGERHWLLEEDMFPMASGLYGERRVSVMVRTDIDGIHTRVAADRDGIVATLRSVVRSQPACPSGIYIAKESGRYSLFSETPGVHLADQSTSYDGY